MTTPDRGKVEERRERREDCSVNPSPDSGTWGEMDASCTGQNNLHALNCSLTAALHAACRSCKSSGSHLSPMQWEYFAFALKF